MQVRERKKKNPSIGYTCKNADMRKWYELFTTFKPVITIDNCGCSTLHKLLIACKEGQVDVVHNILLKQEPSSQSFLQQTRRNKQSNPKFQLGDARARNVNINNSGGAIDIQDKEGEPIDINSTTIDKWAAIHVACFYSQTAVVHLLLQLNANLNDKTNQIWTPLFISVFKDNVEIIDLLIQSKRVDFKRQGSSDNSNPLHVAALLGKKDIFLKLLNCGFDLFLEDVHQRSPLYYSYGMGMHKMTKTILSLYTPQNCTQLLLNGCGMFCLPSDEILQSLIFLEVLDVSNNNLQYLSPVISILIKLQLVVFKNNPFHAMPPAYRTVDWPKMKSYLSTQYKLFRNWNSRCCIVVGDKGVGKSTLVRDLCLDQSNSNRSKSFTVLRRSKSSNQSSGEISADQNFGFMVRCGAHTTKQGPVQMKYWEISNQLSESPVHQLLMTAQAVYMIVFNLENLSLVNIDYWINQYKSLRLGDSPIVIVGTHSDNPACGESYRRMVMDVLKERYPLGRYKGLYDNHFFCVSGSSFEGCNELKDFMSTIILNENRAKLPPLRACSWMNLNYFLSETELKFICYDQLRAWAKQYFNIEKHDFNDSLQFIQSDGNILYFGPKKEDLNFIIMDKPWFIKVILKLIHKNPLIRSGIIAKGSFSDSMSGSDLDRDSVVQLLERFKILFPIPDTKSNISPDSQDYEKLYYIPTTLNEAKPKGLAEIWPVFPPVGQYDYKRIYKFEELPIGLIYRIIAECFYIPEINCNTIWKNGAVFTASQKFKVKITFQAGEEFLLEISLRCAQKENPTLLRTLIDIIESIIETSYPHLTHLMKRLIPCAHCIMRRAFTVDPYLFSYEQCVSAVTSGVPVLFCKDIPSASRCVRIDKLAPDISFAGINHVKDSDFKVTRQIGRGGFGLVNYGLLKKNSRQSINYKWSGDSSMDNQWNTETCIEIAVKELSGLTGSFEQQIDSFGDFLREVYIMSYLNHANLVNMFGICLNSPPPRLIMEYIPCGDLFQLLREKQSKKESLSIEFISKITLDIALGMNYLHSITPPIIHRDLRSPNIFLVSLDTDSKICAKVADFGLSRVTPSNKVQGTLGSWQWMAPETLDINGSEVEYNEKADVYSFAVILWEMFSCDFPFDEYLNDSRFSSIDPRGNPTFKFEEIKTAIAVDKLRPTIPAHTPQKFVDLIKSCWNTIPEARPDFRQIASQFCDNIEAITGEKNDISEVPKKEKEKDNTIIHIENQSPFTYSFESFIQILNSEGVATKALSPHSLAVVDDRVWVGCKDGTIIIYDLENAEEETRWKAHEGSIYSIIMTADYYVWTFGGDGLVKLYPAHAKWEYDLKKTMQTGTKSPTPLRCAKLIETRYSTVIWAACPDKQMIFIWDVEENELIKTITLDPNKNQPIFDILYHNDIVWVASFELIFLFDPKTFEMRGSFEAHPKSMVNSLIISNGFLWSAGNTGEIRLWDTSDPNEVSLYHTVNAHISKILCLSNINGFVWSGSFDKTIIVWDPATNAPITELESHEDSVRSIYQVEDKVWSLGYDPKIVIWKPSN